MWAVIAVAQMEPFEIRVSRMQLVRELPREEGVDIPTNR